MKKMLINYILEVLHAVIVVTGSEINEKSSLIITAYLQFNNRYLITLLQRNKRDLFIFFYSYYGIQLVHSVFRQLDENT